MNTQQLIDYLQSELDNPASNIDILLSREMVRTIIHCLGPLEPIVVQVEELDGYQLAALVDKQIADDVGLAEGWTGVDIRSLQERLKYIRTIGTTCNLLETELTNVLRERYRDGIRQHQEGLDDGH